MPVLKEEVSLSPGDLLEWAESESALRDWYVMYTKPRHEKAVARHLLAHDVPFYLPLVRKKNLYRGRAITALVPVFSSYVFVFGTADDRVTALQSNRVVNVIDVAPPAQPQLCHELCNLQRLIESDVPVTIEGRISPGQRVRVRQGLLRGLEGTVLKRRGETRLLVSVGFMSQGVSASVEDFMVEPL